jgi:SAM-dependent methyltransferase
LYSDKRSDIDSFEEDAGNWIMVPSRLLQRPINSQFNYSGFEDYRRRWVTYSFDRTPVVSEAIFPDNIGGVRVTNASRGISDDQYADQVAAEQAAYRDCLDVHELPEIFHYWSNRYVKPKLQQFGFSSPNDMFFRCTEASFRNGSRRRRLVSAGAGNCMLEVELAARLEAQGYTDFVIDCLDINNDMLARGAAAAARMGISAHLDFRNTDLNHWRAECEYDVVLANQSLHHIFKPENLFAEISRALKPDGVFLLSDIIGRNGHMRWPEAKVLVDEFWRRLPPPYRYNRSLHRYEETFQDWDCSGEGFEGIRAQDILRLLLEHFKFDIFIPFANVIEPFVDRAFGGNFDPSRAWDRQFIDEVHHCDDQELAAGNITPTHLVAVISKIPPSSVRYPGKLSPERCVRDPSREAPNLAPGRYTDAGYRSWPDADWQSVLTAYARLAELQDRYYAQETVFHDRTRWAVDLDRKIEGSKARIIELQQETAEKTEWAQRLDMELHAARCLIRELQGELQNRTAWAHRLDAERDGLARKLAVQASELAARTAWAHDLDREIKQQAAYIESLHRQLATASESHQADLERLEWAGPLDRRFHRVLDSAFRFIRRVCCGR